MLRRLLVFVVFLALPLLLAAVLPGLVPAQPAPLAASSSEPAQVGFYDVALAGAADLSSEEHEPLQATAPAPRGTAKRHQWLASALTTWPLRAPDELLRPPMALPCA